MNGSIEAYDSASGRRYRVRYRSPDRRQHNKRGFKTKREAELFLSSIDMAKSRGEWIDASAGRVTVKELGELWLTNHGPMKPSASRSIESAWRVHVVPNFGSFRVADVRHSDVQKWVAEMSAGLGFTSVSRAYGVLAGILDVAERDRRISANPARGVKMPRRVPKRKKYLTHAQVDALASEVSRHATLVLFLSYTGLRFGEASGLRVRDLNIERRRVNVVENAVMVGGALHVGSPKTHQLRSVPIPNFLLPLLREEASGKDPGALLFGDGSAHVTLPHSVQGWFAQAVRRAQLRDASFPSVTPHDLRHTAASLAISAGANVKAVQRMLGHASAAMTLDTYADLFDDDLDTVAIALDSHRASAIRPL